MEYAFSDRIKNMTGNAIRDIFKLLARPEVGAPAPSLAQPEESPTLRAFVLGSTLRVAKGNRKRPNPDARSR